MSPREKRESLLFEMQFQANMLRARLDDALRENKADNARGFAFEASLAVGRAEKIAACLRALLQERAP